MADIIKPRKYTVQLTIAGEAERVVMAISEEQAVAKVKKILLADDGFTPRSGRLDAFCWDDRHCWPRLHWSERDPDEDAAEAAEDLETETS